MGDPTLVLALVLGIAATYVWRLGGLLISGRIDADSEVFKWFYCVAYALLAGLIARMIVLPIGPLEATALGARLAAAAVALAMFFLSRKNIGLGVAAGAGALVLLTWVG